MTSPIRALACALACALSLGAAEPAKTDSVVLNAMQAELDRSMTVFKGGSVPLYFLSYEITEVEGISAHGSFGALVNSNQNKRRILDIDLRVGDASLDNTHQIRGDRFGSMGMRMSGGASIPIEDTADAIRSVIWYQTDKRYKTAVEQLTKVKTNVKVKVAEEDKAADFCTEPASAFSEATPKIKADKNVLEEKVRLYTAPFAKFGDIYTANATISYQVETRWYVNSEGARIQVSEPGCRISISASTKAEDGMNLPRHETFFGFKPEDLPSDEVVLTKVQKMISDLEALRKAPLVDPYTGPAILSGRASAVFFHEIFGHRVEGHRQKNVDEGQTFKKQLNQRLLPDTFEVYCDPTLDHYGKMLLSGHYTFDNQGVKARRVPLIEAGVFKGFLMGRTPIEGFTNSNGHGRKQAGLTPVSRQSNLIVECKTPVSHAALKQQLIERVKQQGKPYGLLFEDIEGGFTITGRSLPNAFNVLPILVYRIFTDGREELIRGVDLIGTPLTTFSKIVAADDTPALFNGYCGAESGSIPVSAVSPALLVEQIEVQKKDKNQDRIPILPAPLEKE